MAMWTVREQNLAALLTAGTFSERYVPVPVNGSGGFARWTGGTELARPLRAPRSEDALKAFCFSPTQVVARYGGETKTAESEPVAPTPLRLVVGLRACDLAAVRYLDRVFTSPPGNDPFYEAGRASQTIVSVDCVRPHETCFCNLVGGQPWATEGFDVNLTPIEGAYVIEAGSQAGRALIEAAGDCVVEATPEDLARRDQVRHQAEEALASANGAFAADWKPRDGVAHDADSAAWDRLGADCVECGACTQICPTCHCFFLCDRAADGRSFERLRGWDSCLWSGYSRMAGMDRMKPNPRAQFRSRFANRFLHKFVWSPQQWDLLGCVGCGRCVEACPGAIDLRKVMCEVQV